MTEFQPHTDAGGASSLDPGQPTAPPESYGPPPMSKAAVTGFVSSLVFCVPGLSPLLGLIFGIVGIAATSGGRRRGRGLAIAAIPIALVVGAGHCYLAYFMGVVTHRMLAFPSRVVPVFRASSTKVPEAAAEAYQLSSAGFRRAVSEEQFQAWVSEVIAERGQLQSFKQSRPPFDKDPRGGNVVIAHLAGDFVNGSAVIDVVMVLNKKKGSWEFNDIRVDGHSPISE
ncbi:MAG: hypothetical protein JSV19_06940 [Phycisphaerales bacterium]|nr:MAG: hypothetical protein JSV19_06940 [Phycisphaerales bacterium]